MVHLNLHDGINHPFVINHVAGKYLIYDVNVVAFLRSEWHMCGCLFGTLPQAQQQNVFLGLPLELMDEEVMLLLEKGAAKVLDDSAIHHNAIDSLSNDDIKQILSEIENEGHRLAMENYEAAQQKKQIAIDKAKKSGKWKTKEKKGLNLDDPVIDEAILSISKNSITESLQPGYLPNNGENALSDSGGSIKAESISVLPPGALRQYNVPMTTSAFRLSSSSSSTSIPHITTSRYNAYKYLQSKGYFLSPGLRFGCEFMAYPGDPLRFHSHFLVKGLDYDQEISIMDLVGGGRLGTGVKKAYMMVGGENDLEQIGDTNELSVRCFCLEWGGFG